MGKTVAHISFYTPWERKRIARIVFALLLGALVWSFFSNTLLHQLQKPVIKFPYVDPTYWIMHYLGIPELITGNFVMACTFDTALFASCILSFMYPEKRLYCWSFIILYFIYFITFNTFGTHHTNHKIGFLFIAIPFTVADYKSFNFLWQGLRYFLLFAYADAFLWKLFRLSWLHPDQGLLIMKKNVAAFLYFEPNTLQAGLYRWSLQHPAWVNGAYLVGMLLEGLFIVGFFTRKFDHYLFILSILLPVGFYLMADANFFEFLILNLTLINFHKLFVRAQ
ncbi:hypothetical protein FAM09_30255 [Niastella caeni]|uniref:HTTM domain-containing protein n=1 Tax=Niastella caeni TaxID=2569763 RepID=A0A4S8HD34_9BACT|nr:hypothetical protein [Niastella caeni]THU30442.1 hypothetical protein FAM09_30255 [Niastella caeni]